MQQCELYTSSKICHDASRTGNHPLLKHNKLKMMNELNKSRLLDAKYLTENYTLFSAYASLVEPDPTLFLLHRWCTMLQHLLYGNDFISNGVGSASLIALILHLILLFFCYYFDVFG